MTRLAPQMPSGRGLGLIPDPPTLARYGEIGAGDDGPVEAHRFRDVARGDLDQSVTQSCVWFAKKQALWCLLGLLGYTQQGLSELAGYYTTRKRTAQGGDIWDGGCRPSDATEVLRELGWVPESKWRFVAANVDVEPAWDALVEATDRTWYLERRILSSGVQRKRDMRRTLGAEGKLARPVEFGLTVDAAYERWDGSTGPWRRMGQPVGRHMVTGLGHDALGVWTMGSYGPTHGLGGWMHVSWDTVEDPFETSDLYVPDIDRTKYETMLKKAGL